MLHRYCLFFSNSVLKFKQLYFCFRASGHVDRFADLMSKDVKTGECFRVDHLIKAHLEKLSADKKATDDVKAECKDIVIKVKFSFIFFKFQFTIIFSYS